MWDDFFFVNGVLFRRSFAEDGLREFQQLLAPRCLRWNFLNLLHTEMTGGHLGVARTRAQCRSRAYWPGWAKDVERFVRSCVPCARYKRRKPPRQGPLCPILTGAPFEVLSLDITGPHPRSSNGHVYILTIMDHFSKFAFGFPIRNQEASTIARIFAD